MKPLSNSILRRLMLGAIITLVGGTVCTAQTPGSKPWKVKYESGTETLTKGVSVTVTVSADTITGQAAKGQSFTIPVSGITEVSYDTVEKKRTKSGAALMVASPLAGLILMGTKTTRHFVNITSKVDGQEREVSFLVEKGDREAFLAELQRVTNHPWRDLSAERKKTETELDHQKREKTAVQLDRKTRVGDVELKPGLYQIVLLERENNTGELYFFAGKDVKPQKSVANVKVDIVTQPSTATTAKVSYQETGGVSAISEIQTAAKTFRVRKDQ
jgi:hypothetical protein